MARWFKEHLGFKTTKAPPPAPPKPDYPQPDILTAYKLQKELDFEDPYTPAGLSSTGSPDVKFVSPKHRLIKVEAAERSGSSPGSSSAVTAVKSPGSPPAETENSKAEKVRDRSAFTSSSTGTSRAGEPLFSID
ncbi:hypothetical protein PO909_032833 [Leuciscus waleckii]